MSTPKVLIGDIFSSQAKTLVNTVNCVGIMGKGIAQEFKKRYPQMFEEYKTECDQGKILPGVPKLYSHNLFGNSVINFPTKKHWKSPSLLKDIEKGLDIFLEKYKEWGVESVAFPPLGCGNGGLSWDVVGPLMYQKLSQIDIPVEIYAPFGTAAEKLKPEFLTSETQSKQKKGVYLRQKITPGNFSALEVLYRLQNQKYTKPVGRVIFQKIYYILTELSVETDLEFSQSSYGPYSKDLKTIQTAFANTNLTKESQVDRMMKIEVGSAYYDYKKEFSDELKEWESAIAKTVDLFSRIKNTDQAEEVTTIIFSVKALKKQHPRVSEQEVIAYIMKWKKTWNKASKKDSLTETIRNLTAMGWISVEFSKELAVAY